MNRALLLGTLALATPAFADTTTAAGAADPIKDHTISMEDATKGLKGSGALSAKLEVEQGGKPLGTFTCELFDKQAPKTVANFVGLSRGVRPWKDPKTGEWMQKPLYNGLVFHRVIPGFMVQGGDPKGNGTGDPGYEFGDEFDDSLKMDKGGLLAMANRGPGTNGSQFFITEKEAPWLSGKHTIFGACEPIDLVKKITSVPRGPRDVPNDPVLLKKVTISRVSAKKGK